MAEAAERAAADGASARWSASPTAGCRRRRWPAQLVAEGRLGDDPARARAVPAGLDRRPGRRRCRGGCRRTRPARARSATSARTSSTSPSSSPAQRLTGVSAGCSRRSSSERPLPPSVGGLSRRRRRRERGAGDRRRRRGVPRPVRPAARSASFEATRFATGRKNAIRIEINGSTGSLAFDFEDMNVLQFYDGTEPPATAGLPPDPRHRARAPVRRRLVAARPRARLRARLHPPGRRPGHRDRRAATDPAPSFADGLQVQRVLAAVEAQRRRRQRAGPRPRPDDRGGTAMTRPITLFTGQWADLPFEEVAGSPPSGATTASRSPAGATTSTSSGPPSDDAYVAGAARHARASTACRSSPSPTTSTARPSATTRSTSGTAASCPARSGATATPRASGSGRPRR